MDRLSNVGVVGCVLLAAGALGVSAASAATITVTTTGDDNIANGNCTLREAIGAAVGDSAVDLCAAGSGSEGDVVVLPAGTYPINQGFFFLTSLGGPLVFRGPEVTPPTAIIDINPTTSQRFIRLGNSADVTLENLQIRNGDVRTNQSLLAGGGIASADTQDVLLTLRNVWMTGNKALFGGALSFESGGAARLLIEDSLFQGNLVQFPTLAGPQGGAIRLQLRGQACGRILNTTILQNRAETAVAGAAPYGGGVHAQVTDDASLEVRRTTIGYNEADAGTGINPNAAGMYLSGSGSGRATIEDVVFEGNDLQGLDGVTYPPSALHVFATFSSSFILDRVRMVRNDVGQAATDVVVDASSSGSVTARNVLVANGPARGTRVTASGGPVTLAHWTVTGHTQEGLRLTHSSANELRLDNSLLWNNGTDLAQSGTPIVDPSNLIGVNPLFVAPIADDYSLAAGSPAIDFGDMTLASMSRYDAAHGPRVDGNDTDAGAYERGAIFADGFNTGPGGYCTP